MRIRKCLGPLRFTIRPSHGTARLYAVLNPYGRYGFMVGWNGKNGHYVSISGEERRAEQVSAIQIGEV